MGTGGGMDPIDTAGTGGITAATPLRVFLSRTSDLGEPDVKGSFVAAAALRIDPAVRPVGSGSAEERVERALLQRGIALAVNMGGHGKRRVGRKRSSSTPRSTPGTRCAPAT